MVCERELDGELLAATRAGDAEAFGEFYRRRRALVVAFLGRRAGSAEAAADLLGETFAAALAATLDSGRDLPEEPVAWLLTIARNKLLDSFRRGRVEHEARRRLAIAPLELGDEELERIDALIDETDVVGELARLLPPDQREALIARVLDERDYAAIASELECSEAVVRKRVSRALRTLREAIGEGRR
ncbi:MAG: RNA polymerase sigma factor [Solirubrobacteraceae bacterium]